MSTMRKSRKRGPITSTYLERAALHYLERYASSREGVRRVLARRVTKAVSEERCDDPEQAQAWIEAIIERFASSGLIDDRAFAEGRTASLRRRGESARRIEMKLREKGIDPDLAASALAEADGEDAHAAEFAAACRLARRRRIGPMRPEGERAERRDKDMAALARAGFSLDIARRVLDLADADALDRQSD